MKRKSLLNVMLGASILCTLAGSTSFLHAAGFEPETAVETKAEINHDEKAIKVLEKSIEVSGGLEMYENAKSVHTTGTINVPAAGLSGTVEVFAAIGGNLFIKINIPGFGEQLQGLHKGVGWSMEPMGGPKLLEDEMRMELEKQADVKAAIKYKELYSGITYGGETEFNGLKVHQIDLVSSSTGESSTQYYSVETGLMAGSVLTAITEMGKMKVTTTINEYAEYNGMTMPSSSTESVGAMGFNTTTDSAEFNNVDMSVFEFPAAIKALIEASKEDAQGMDD